MPVDPAAREWTGGALKQTQSHEANKLVFSAPTGDRLSHLSVRL